MGDMIIDENGIRDRKTGKPMMPVSPRVNFPPEKLKHLTPEQIKKLEEANRRFRNHKKRIVVVKPPLPPPSPEP